MMQQKNSETITCTAIYTACAIIVQYNSFPYARLNSMFVVWPIPLHLITFFCLGEDTQTGNLPIPKQPLQLLSYRVTGADKNMWGNHFVPASPLNVAQRTYLVNLKVQKEHLETDSFLNGDSIALSL